MELESGGDGFDGAPGDGAGKWRLLMEPEHGGARIQAMSLMRSASGHLTNLSSRTAVRE